MAVTIAAANYPAFTGSAGVSGKRMVLYLNYGVNASEASPVWTLLGGLTSHTLSYSVEANSVQTKDTGYWATNTPVAKSAELSADVILLRDNVAQEAIESFITDDDITSAKQALQFAIVDLDTLVYTKVKAVPTSWEITADAEDMVQKSLSANVTGEPEVLTGFVVPA